MVCGGPGLYGWGKVVTGVVGGRFVSAKRSPVRSCVVLANISRIISFIITLNPFIINSFWVCCCSANSVRISDWFLSGLVRVKVVTVVEAFRSAIAV